MSVCYDVREHMVISDADEGYDYVGFLRGHLALMGALMLCGEVRYCDINLTADQTVYKFSGILVNQDLHTMVDALEGAKSINWSAYWDYRWTAWSGIADLASVNTICEQMHEADEQEIIPESVFYSCYVEADCDDSIGGSQAYGVWNGKRYHGDLSFNLVDHIDEGGCWRTPQTAVTLEFTWSKEADRARIQKIVKDLAAFSDSNNIDINEKEISVFLNNVILHSEKDIEKYLNLTGELNELTNGECIVAEEFEDSDSLNPRILRFDLDGAGQWKYWLAEV